MNEYRPNEQAEAHIFDLDLYESRAHVFGWEGVWSVFLIDLLMSPGAERAEQPPSASGNRLASFSEKAGENITRNVVARNARSLP